MFYSRSRSVLKIFQSKNAENLEREKRNLARADQILPTKNLPNLAHYAYPQKLLEHVEILDLPFKYSSWGGRVNQKPSIDPRASRPELEAKPNARMWSAGLFKIIWRYFISRSWIRTSDLISILSSWSLEWFYKVTISREQLPSIVLCLRLYQLVIWGKLSSRNREENLIRCSMIAYRGWCEEFDPMLDDSLQRLTLGQAVMLFVLRVREQWWPHLSKKSGSFKTS